jgi:hypothetical protein
MPPTTAGQLAADVHDFTVQAWPPQLAAFAQTVVPLGQVAWLQLPLIVVHPAFATHTRPGGLLHRPQSAFCTQTLLAMLAQVPEAGQSVDCKQACFVLLHVPPTIPHCATEVQTAWVMLHLPMSTQSDCCRQLEPFTLHAPARLAHCALFVQAALLMLHVPGLGVHTGGAQFATGAQGFSGSGGSRLQPGGL